MAKRMVLKRVVRVTTTQVWLLQSSLTPQPFTSKLIRTKMGGFEVNCSFLTENGTKKMKKNTGCPTFVALEVRMIYTNGGGLSWQVHSLTGQKYKHINKCQAVHILFLIGLNIIYTVDSTMVHSFTHQLCN